jgi:hypothetical protein
MMNTLSFARYLTLPAVLATAACCHVDYVPAPRTLACNDIADWSEQQVCKKKADKYNQDWERRKSATS